MKSLLALALLLCLTACETKATPPEKSEGKVPTQANVDEQVKTGVKDVVKRRGPKWKVDYKGDLNGSIEGGILSVVSVTQTVVAGGAMNKDSTGKATHSLRMVQMHSKDKSIANLSLVLADGTKCVDLMKKGDAPSELTLIDESPKTYHATLKGDLICGEAKNKNITYTAVLKKK